MKTQTDNIEQVEESKEAETTASKPRKELTPEQAAKIEAAKQKAALERQKREKQALLEEERKIFELRYTKLQELNRLERQYQNLKATGTTLDEFAFQANDFDNGYAKIELRDSKGKTWNTSNQNLASSLVEYLKSVITLKIDEQEGKILGFSF